MNTYKRHRFPLGAPIYLPIMSSRYRAELAVQRNSVRFSNSLILFMNYEFAMHR